MKFIKTLALIFFFFFSMLFFIQNTETLNSQIVIKLEIFQWGLVSPATPLYLLVLFSFVFGSILTSVFFFAERIRLATLARNNQKQANKTEKELKKAQDELETLRKKRDEEEALKAQENEKETEREINLGQDQTEDYSPISDDTSEETTQK